MTDILRPGQNARLQAKQGEDVRVLFSVTGAAPLRLVGVLLDEAGRAIEPTPLLTWRTGANGVQIKLNKGETLSATLHTAALQAPIQSIMFLVAPYARTYFLPNEKLLTAIVSEGAIPVAIESIATGGDMQAAAVCEFYRHSQEGVKVRARGEWRHRELTTLLERLGVPADIIKEQMLYPLPQARHDDTERASLKNSLNVSLSTASDHDGAAPPLNSALDDERPAVAPAVSQATAQPSTSSGTADIPKPKTETLNLDKSGAQQRLTAPDNKFGPIEFRFTWHQRLATRAAVKLDVGCFWETQDGQKGQLNRGSNQFGTIVQPPHVALDANARSAGSLLEETLRIDGNQWPNIRRILFYASMVEGNSPWDALDVQIKLTMPGQPEIHAELTATDKHGPVTPLLLLENRSDQMRVSLPGGCYESHVSLDTAFDFGLGWQNDREKKPGSNFHAVHELTWQPRKPKGILPYLSHTCFNNAAYIQAESLMLACLAAAAQILIADGHVTVEERRQTIDAMMHLPIGKYFAEFEVRMGLDQILSDLKHQRKAADDLTLRLLLPFRGSADAAIVIHGMQQIAMLDGQVSINEERMVERLTRYLRPAPRGKESVMTPKRSAA